MAFFIRYFISIITGAVVSVSLFLLVAFPSPRIFLVVFTFCLVFLLSAYIYINRIKGKLLEGVLLLLTTFLSFIFLINLVEWGFLRWFLVIFFGLIVAFLFHRLLYERAGLSYREKPFRRMKMMLWVFNTYSFLTTFFAFSVFFQKIPFWLLGLLGAFISALFALMIWKMYFDVKWKDFSLWFLIVFLIMSQILWVMNLLPLGYLSLGLFCAWFWYVVQLFIRFHLSSTGIIWKKQIVFLITNLILYFGLLFFMVRWI